MSRAYKFRSRSQQEETRKIDTGIQDMIDGCVPCFAQKCQLIEHRHAEISQLPHKSTIKSKARVRCSVSTQRINSKGATRPAVAEFMQRVRGKPERTLCNSHLNLTGSRRWMRVASVAVTMEMLDGGDCDARPERYSYYCYYHYRDNPMGYTLKRGNRCLVPTGHALAATASVAWYRASTFLPRRSNTLRVIRRSLAQAQSGQGARPSSFRESTPMRSSC